MPGKPLPVSPLFFSDISRFTRVNKENRMAVCPLMAGLPLVPLENQFPAEPKKSEYLLLLSSFRNFMSLSGIFFRCILIVVLVFFAVQGVSAWNVQNLMIRPADSSISPQTPVTATCTVHFDSWMTGLTFPRDSTLDMYTDLVNATWDVTMTDYEQDPPAATPLLEKKSAQVRVNGWTLSYSSRQIDLNVRVRGTAPDVDRTQEKVMIRVQERDSEGKPITQTAITRKSIIVAATPLPTTPQPTEAATTIATTMATPPDSVTPARKQTWAPGPDPLLICGMLAGLATVVAIQKKK